MSQSLIWAIATLVWGLLNVFYGYRLFRLFLALSGAFIGSELASRYFPTLNPTLHLLIIILAAVVTAILAYALYSLTFALLGALAGFSVALLIIRFLPVLAPFSLIVIVFGILLGLAFSSGLKSLVIVIATAAGGASLTLQGLDLLFPFIPSLGFLVKPGLSSLIWLILFIVGTLSQLNRHSLPD